MSRGSDDEWYRTLESLGLGGERERRMQRARDMGMAFADLDRIQIEPETRALISADLARELRALPVKRDGGTLWVLFAEPIRLPRTGSPMKPDSA